MNVSDLLGSAIRLYPRDQCDACRALAWTDAILQLAYAAGDVELEDKEVVNDLKRAALSLRLEALSELNHKKHSAGIDSCGTLSQHIATAATSLRRLCEALLPEILPYFDISVCT